MAVYPSKLVKKSTIANGTMEFQFEKPEGFVHRAGQYIDLELINPPDTDAEGNMRSFSLVSAPHEPHLAIATRIRDTAFKRVLSTGVVGMPVTIHGPYGSFSLHNDTTKPAVFLAGGIGVTPFMSIIRDVLHRSLRTHLFVFYPNRTPKHAPFVSELQEADAASEEITLVATITSPESSAEPWTGARGYITKKMIQTYVTDMTQAIYYLAGSPDMVAAMRIIVSEAGVNDDNIKTEEFAGYEIKK